jgi:hypothetical protein
MEAKLDIAKDYEYIKTQVHYLDNFAKKVEMECSNYFGSKNYWGGIPLDAPIYPHIDKWVSNYQKLHKHIWQQSYEAEVMELVATLHEIKFIKPSLTSEDLKSFSVWKKVLYFLLPPFRWNYNKKKVKEVKAKLNEFKQTMENAKKFVIRLEGHYFYS